MNARACIRKAKMCAEMLSVCYACVLLIASHELARTCTKRFARPCTNLHENIQLAGQNCARFVRGMIDFVFCECTCVHSQGAILHFSLVEFSVVRPANCVARSCTDLHESARSFGMMVCFLNVCTNRA